jgi:hypothetical protein
LGLQATVKKVSDPRGDKISLSFHKGGEVGTYDKILLYTITKMVMMIMLKCPITRKLR